MIPGYRWNVRQEVEGVIKGEMVLVCGVLRASPADKNEWIYKFLDHFHSLGS